MQAWAGHPAGLCLAQAISERTGGWVPLWSRHTMLANQLTGGKIIADLLLFAMSQFLLYQ
jgi:hypothetical protein